MRQQLPHIFAHNDKGHPIRKNHTKDDRFLKGRTSPRGSLSQGRQLLRCSYCADSSPQEIDPMLIHEAAKIDLLEQGKRSSEANHPVFLERGFKHFDIFSALQTKLLM